MRTARVFLYLVTVVLLIVWAVGSGCENGSDSKNIDADLNKSTFSLGWYKGFLAAQTLIIETGGTNKNGRDVIFFKDSVEFATYIDLKFK